MAKIIKMVGGNKVGLILNKKEASLLLTLLMRTRHKGMAGGEGLRGRADNAIFYALYDNNIGAKMKESFLVAPKNRIELTDTFVNAPEEE